MIKQKTQEMKTSILSIQSTLENERVKLKWFLCRIFTGSLLCNLATAFSIQYYNDEYGFMKSRKSFLKQQELQQIAFSDEED